MKVRKLYPWMADFQKVNKLYDLSFHKDCRLPFWKLAALTVVRPAVEILGYYDGDLFCGFTFSIHTNRYLYINSMAVDPALRSHGYGKQMIDLLHQRHPLPTVGVVKKPIPGTPEYEEDLRRVHFWEERGCDFFGQQHVLRDDQGVTYIVGATDTNYDRSAYQEIIDMRSCGLGATIRILKRKFNSNKNKNCGMPVSTQ